LPSPPLLQQSAELLPRPAEQIDQDSRARGSAVDLGEPFCDLLQHVDHVDLIAGEVPGRDAQPLQRLALTACRPGSPRRRPSRTASWRTPSSSTLTPASSAPFLIAVSD
jgi:hypothetical protein